MVEDVLEVWRIHEQINTYLLNLLPEKSFTALTLFKNGQLSKGSTVARVFAHPPAGRISLRHPAALVPVGIVRAPFQTGIGVSPF
jgi:hypothetical protein